MPAETGRMFAVARADTGNSDQANTRARMLSQVPLTENIVDNPRGYCAATACIAAWAQWHDAPTGRSERAAAEWRR